MIDIVHTEVAERPKRFIRSEGGLYALLLVAALGIVSLSNRLTLVYPASALFVQTGLYLAMGAFAWWISRRRLCAYRYTLTRDGLYVDRLLGRRETGLAAVPLAEILFAGPYDGEKEKELQLKRGPYARTGKLEDSYLVAYAQQGKRLALCISATEKMQRSLLEAWKKENP